MNYQRFFLLLADTTNQAEEPDIVLWILIGLAIAAVVVSLFVLYFRFFRIRALSKKVRELESMFSTSHGLLYGEISTTIKRLEDIKDLNLCYVDEFAEMNRKYKDIHNVLDAYVSATVVELGTLLKEKRLKELKTSLQKAKEKVSEYVDSVNKLKIELDEKFEVENSCKRLESEVKAKVRSIKSFYNCNVSELKIVMNPLTTAFANLDRALENIGQNINAARYEEANATILNVSQMLDGLNLVIKDLPQICVQLSSVLPDKVMTIRTRLEEMTKEGYPLYQILTKSTIELYNSEIDKMIALIQQLSVDGVNEKINAIHSNIDKANELMDAEIVARKTFFDEKDGVLATLSKTQGEYLNLNRDLDRIRQIYKLDEEDLAILGNIKVLVERSDASKRTLDTLINSSTKQPFTVMVEKLHLLGGQTIETTEAVNGFTKYLFSLLDDVNRAKKTNEEYYAKLKEIELCIHNIGMDCVREKYAEPIDNIYSYIDELYQLLQLRPMDVKRINMIQNHIVQDCNALIGDLNLTVSTMNQAEAAIVNANRNRALNVEVNAAVSQAEHLFFAGNFEEAMTILSAIHFEQGGLEAR